MKRQSDRDSWNRKGRFLLLKSTRKKFKIHSLATLIGIIFEYQAPKNRCVVYLEKLLPWLQEVVT